MERPRAAGWIGQQSHRIALRGKKFFAGADISEFGSPPADPWPPKLLDRLEACGKPVISALHGTVLGGGLETAMATNYRIAHPDTKLGLPVVTLGILPDAGGTQRLPRLVGIATAIEMIISGKMVNSA